MKNNFTITIGRQIGCGGLIIGKKLAQNLNISFYDSEVIKIVAKESGLSEDCFKKIDEKKELNLVESLIMRFSLNINDLNTDNILNSNNLFIIQSEIIKKISDKESCVFMGRCVDYILRDHKNKISFFLTANLEDRIKTVANENNISEKDAGRLVKKSENKRAAYYNYYTNKKWGYANSYDFCLNTSFFGIDKTVEIIENIIIEKFFD